MMGLKPWETDRLTPAAFHGLWKHWLFMNVKSQPAELAPPTEEELRAAAEAERLYGSGA